MEARDLLLPQRRKGGQQLQLLEKDLIKSNCRRFAYSNFQVGDKVLKLGYYKNNNNKSSTNNNKENKKLKICAYGPYRVEKVHKNDGTITIRLAPNVIERVSLRRVKPYYYYCYYRRRR